MRLRNKKTGYITNWCIDKDVIRTCDSSIVYTSLAELNEDWEDYEEPKGKWFISNNGQVHNDEEHERFREERKQIGNYFDTREEAEKAVEKLKAWKRLRDRYGFAFNGKVTNSKGKFCGVKVKYDNEAVTMKEARQAEHDVAILFGGEE